MEIVDAKHVHKTVLKDFDKSVTLKNILQSIATHPPSEEIRSMLVENLLKEARYAILSHRWGSHELLFKDLQMIQSIPPPVIQKAIELSKSSEPNFKDVPIHLWLDQEKREREPNKGNGTTMRDRGGSPPTRKIETGHSPPPVIDTLFELAEKLPQLAVNSGFRKLVHFCHIALHTYNCRFVWMDTCCIDKSSSSELNEAIKSSFDWYQRSTICIVYLGATRFEGSSIKKTFWDPWFTRGWTLQELLAPSTAKFYDKNWKVMFPASKNDKTITRSGTDDYECDYDADTSTITNVDEFMHGVSYFTGIPISSILNFKPGLKNIRQRLAWASQRQTTRIEDIAYSLIGLLNLTMPIAYGEGRRSFYRLQEAIIRNSNDRSLFIWFGRSAIQSSVLAFSPSCFASPCNVVTRNVSSSIVSGATTRSHTSLTNHGLAIPLILYDNATSVYWLKAIRAWLPVAQLPAVDQLLIPQYRLAILGYDENVKPDFIYMLLIEFQEHGQLYYTRHPWQPQAIPGFLFYEPLAVSSDIVYIR